MKFQLFECWKGAFIHLAHHTPLTSIELFDFTGRKVSNTAVSGKSEHVISMEQLAAGTYFIKIGNGNAVTTRKIQKL
ncbi:MAG: T9SS type A sorting domain-containing protein [Bacteroidota bacterium]|nr:T9SS type A sorting domain-containing protein [Bacteroidota bacterium]